MKKGKARPSFLKKKAKNFCPVRWGEVLVSVTKSGNVTQANLFTRFRCPASTLLAAVLCATLPISALASAAGQACDVGSHLALDGKPYWHVDAAPASGFSFPYVLFIPARAASAPPPHLLVEPNNTGFLTTDLEKLDADAVKSVTHNFLAERLGDPVLTPEFPRPLEGHSDIYTHALSRETMLLPPGPLHRIDLQLIAMVADAQRRLAACGLVVNRKIRLDGFSASAMFASRFVYLHPELVAAAAFGGINSFIMLPATQISGHALNYPLGLADYAAFTGHPFDQAAYNAVPQFAYMGVNDANDAASEGGDAYSSDDVALIHELIGARMTPDRWNAVQRTFRASGASMTFTTYERIGHSIDERVLDDLTKFFENSVNGRGQSR